MREVMIGTGDGTIVGTFSVQGPARLIIEVGAEEVAEVDLNPFEGRDPSLAASPGATTPSSTTAPAGSEP